MAPIHRSATEGKALAHRMLTALRVLQVRLRFILVLLVAFIIVGKWDVLRNYWDKMLAGGAVDTSHSISSDTEFFCPMCPGVLSDWPSKCPVCNMALVRRKRGDMVPLPDGVLSRTQLSPYRLQLAGIKTWQVEYQALYVETVLSGLIEETGSRLPAGKQPHVCLTASLHEKDLPFLRPGQLVDLTCEALPRHDTIRGRVRTIQPELSRQIPSFKAGIVIENALEELRTGMLLTGRVRTPVVQLESFTRSLIDEWWKGTSTELLQSGLPIPSVLRMETGVESLIKSAVKLAITGNGRVLAVPEGAVIDTGTRKVVYVESGPGMFDSLEVILGPRCGDFYPVIRGLEAGQNVVTAGAFLLDAETRLNPSAAVAYFGAARSSESVSSTRTSTRPDQAAIQQQLQKLPGEDQLRATAQKLCPVTSEPLGSMGVPVRQLVAGKIVYLCCKSCEAELRKQPDKYLAKLTTSPASTSKQNP